MRRIVGILLFAIAVLIAAPASALTPHGPVITEADAPQAVVVNAGEDFFIALSSNKSTGYAWTSNVADGVVLAYEGNVYQQLVTGRVGAPGQQLFIFHANRPGSTTISFTYARTFEPNAQPSKALTFSITVQ